VKWAPKPDPVKRRPPSPAAFILRNLPYLWSIFVTSQVLTNVANASLVAGYRRHPPRRLVSSSSATPTAPPGSAFLASPGCHWFHLDLSYHELIGLHPVSRWAWRSKRDVGDQPGFQRQGISVPCIRGLPRPTTSPASLRLSYALRFNAGCGFFACLKPHYHQSEKPRNRR
jgi:hypothetical protein